jgi:hypothetical protein
MNAHHDEADRLEHLADQLAAVLTECEHDRAAERRLAQEAS